MLNHASFVEMLSALYYSLMCFCLSQMVYLLFLLVELVQHLLRGWWQNKHFLWAIVIDVIDFTDVFCLFFFLCITGEISLPLLVSADKGM